MTSSGARRARGLQDRVSLLGKAGLSGIRSWCVTRYGAVLGFSPAGRRHRTRATTRARRDGAATTGGEGRCHERNKRSTAEPMGVKVGWHSRAPARWRPCAVRISFPQAERMAAMSRIRFSSGSPWLINACATRSATFRQRPLRPAPRARRLRCRLRGSRQGASLPRYRPARPPRAHEPGAPWRLRLRSQYRRRRRHPHPDAGSILPQGSGPTADAAPRRGLVRRRPRLPAEGRRRALARDGDDRADCAGGRSAAARLARRADQRQRARSACCRGGADLQTALHLPAPTLSPTATRSSASCT